MRMPIRFAAPAALTLAIAAGCGSTVETASSGATTGTATSSTSSTSAATGGAGGTASPAGGSGGAGGATSTAAGGSGGGTCGAEVCNGKDDDCDGTIDEGCACAAGESAPCYDGPAATAGVGACKSGTRSCAADGTWGPCAGEVTPAPESCNGVDDDCNGPVDDGIAPITCGLGACQVTAAACSGGQPGACTPLPAAPKEACNGVDDTCDGAVDEGCDCLDGATQGCYSGPPGAAGVGACVKGTQTCAGGAWGACAGEVLPTAEACNGVDDDCNGVADDGLGAVSCGVGACSATVPACEAGKPVACLPGAAKPEQCNGADDDCNGVADDGLGQVLCGQGACAASVPACVGGQQGVCSPGQPGEEICNGQDDDCDGQVDEAFGNCGPGQACAGGACVDDCAGPGATPCGAGTVCNVGDGKAGQCVPVGGACVVTGPFEACGGKVCGPGSSCNPKIGACVADLPCIGLTCDGGVCHGAACPCDRPAPTCAVAPLASLNAAAFTYGLVDLDVDLQCGAWGVTVLSGPDYLRKMSPAGQVTSVTGVTNLNMGEVAAIQGMGSIGQGNVVDVALTYNCCANCGCQAGSPQGVAHFDAQTGTLPMVIPAIKTTTGPGPFGDGYLDTGPQGLSYGLGRQVYVGNIATNGDVYSVDLDTSTKSLVATLPSRVYAAAPYDGTRLLVAMATKELVLLHVADGSTTPFATAPADITSLARDSFTGDVYVGLKGGAVQRLSGKGKDLGQFAKAKGSGRISIAHDNYLYQVNVAPVAYATVERFALPASY